MSSAVWSGCCREVRGLAGRTIYSQVEDQTAMMTTIIQRAVDVGLHAIIVPADHTYSLPSHSWKKPSWS